MIKYGIFQTWIETLIKYVRSNFIFKFYNRIRVARKYNIVGSINNFLILTWNNYSGLKHFLVVKYNKPNQASYSYEH